MSGVMVERVARAILKARYYDCEPEHYNGLEDFFATIDDELVHQARAEACAAIAAMREPSESMADAARGEAVRLRFDRIPEHDVTRCIFVAMIDAALAGEWAHLADLDKDEIPADVAALAEGEKG